MPSVFHVTGSRQRRHVEARRWRLQRVRRSPRGAAAVTTSLTRASLRHQMDAGLDDRLVLVRGNAALGYKAGDIIRTRLTPPPPFFSFHLFDALIWELRGIWGALNW